MWVRIYDLGSNLQGTRYNGVVKSILVYISYYSRSMQYDSFTVFIPTVVQQKDTIIVYNHITSLLHGSAFFGHLKGGTHKEKHKIG